jgi:predicted amidohydrolase
MKVALIQMNSKNDKPANLATAKALIERAVGEEGPDWIALPEVFDFLGGSKAEWFASAEMLPGGPTYTMMQELAHKHKVFIHAGSVREKVPGETRVYNTTVVFDRSGGEIARYRKMHLFDITAPDGTQHNESHSVAPGEAVVTYDCEGLTVGCAICYDLRFPALFQALADKGAQMIALPANFTLRTGMDHWEVLCRARAIETEAYFCAPGITGSYVLGNETLTSYGHSLVSDPWGHIIAKASDGVGYVAARIDPALVQKVRTMIPVAKHKRAMPLS